MAVRHSLSPREELGTPAMPLHPLIWPLVGIMLSAPGGSQTAPAAAPIAAEAAAAIALAEVDERMTVPVRIAGAGPYRFVIDTGAERTVISRQLATTLDLPAGREIRVMAMSGWSRVGTVTIPSVSLSSVPDIGAIQAPAFDAAHLGAAGLLGIDTLQRHKVTMDFDAGVMTVTPSTKRTRKDHVPRVPGEIVVRAKGLAGQLIVTDAEIDGQTVRVVLDTGSPISIGNLALRRAVGRTLRNPVALELTSVTGGIVTTEVLRAERLRIGGFALNDMPIAFADVAPFANFGLAKRPAVLLGMDALKQFRRVDIDFANREVRFLLPRGVATGRACGRDGRSACFR